MSLIAGRGCRWPPRRDSVSPCAPLSGGRDTHDGHENSPILVFFSNLLGQHLPKLLRFRVWVASLEPASTTEGNHYICFKFFRHHA